MNTATVDAVHAILQAGIALRARFESGEALDDNRELAELKLHFAPLAAQRLDELEDFDFDVSAGSEPEERERLTQATIRYALTCWLDDFLTHHSPAGSRWRERTLEEELYRTSEGSTKFWDEARYAETRGDFEALEVMHLCVMLGFRGDWRGLPVQLEAWARRVGQLLERTPHVWTMPASLDPARPVGPSGRLRLRSLACSLLALFAVIVPAATVFFWRRWPI